jgi:general secretion pathway protein D
MSTINTGFRRVGARLLAVLLVALLAGPGATLAKSGKKFFKKGLEFEEAQRWDRAAEQYALAVADDPRNAEYQLHYARSLTNASLMFTRRGDTLAAQKDYAGAYTAYKQAASYDPTNELAIAKMREMLRIQGLPEEPDGPEKAMLKTKYNRRPAATVEIPRSSRVLTDVHFRDTKVRQAIDSIAESLGLNVIYDSDATQQLTKTFDFDAVGITKATALELILQTNKLGYVQADTRTLIVYPDTPQSRARYQELAVRTFYLRNADVEQVRTLVQSVVGTKQVLPFKSLNALTVKDSPNNIELIESLVASLDKDKAEVLIDVNIYEVSRNELHRIGNQFDTTRAGSLGFLGGVGAEQALRGVVPTTGLYGPAGIALVVPTSRLQFLHEKTKARLLAASQIHVLDAEQHTIRIGRRVPIQTASIPTGGIAVTGNQNQNQNPNNINQFAVQQFQYENVGLNLDVTPTVREDLVQLKMKIETSDVDPEGGVGGNPIFTQRTMSSVASIRDGHTTLIAGVSQELDSDGRRGLPILGSLPILGRLFTVPVDNDSNVDVIIMVTPHILRAPTYGKEDHLAIEAGTQVAPDRQVSIEEILYRAQLEDAAAAEEPIAGTPAPRTTTIEAGAQPGATRPVTARPGETIRTPGGAARPPVVAEEEPSRSVPLAPPGSNSLTQPPAPEVTDEEDEEFLDEEDAEAPEPNAGAQAPKQGTFSLRLSAMQTAMRGRPMPVSLLGSGAVPLNSASLAVAFDSKLLRVVKVESTGVFDGKLGAQVPFEVRDGMLVLTLSRDQGATPAPVNGQLATITFEVIGAGVATLAVVAESSAVEAIPGAGVTIQAEAPLRVTTR